MGRRPARMVGLTFGTLFVRREVPTHVAESKAFEVECISCGRLATRLGGNIRRAARTGATGCECGNRSRRHGLSGHPAYKTWEGMVARCHNPKHQAFPSYGGRGIEVCVEWRSSPELFIAWLERKGWNRGLQVDRADNDKGYSPANCRIVEPVVNANNRRVNRRLLVGGETLTVAEASRRFGLNKTTIKERLNRGWSDQEAVRSVHVA